MTRWVVRQIALFDIETNPEYEIAKDAVHVELVQVTGTHAFFLIGRPD